MYQLLYGRHVANGNRITRPSPAGRRGVWIARMEILPSRNVLGGPLKPCSTAPMTGFFRNGRCDTCAEDVGCHTVCVEVTDEFLTASRVAGNDLSTPRPEFEFPGLKPGDRWCVCASRWLELLEQNVNAPISLAATHARTLELIPLAVLQRHATA